MKKLIIISLACISIACKKKEKNTEATIKKVEASIKTIGTPFTRQIENAHKKNDFLNQEAIRYNINVSFGGNTILDAKISQLCNGSKIRIDKKDGNSIVFDNKEVFMTPANAEDPMARFHIFTWPYFIGLPYKLNDEGTIWSQNTSKKWGDSIFDTSRLSFKEGTGDAPKDWYIVYKNPKTNILEGAAYIVSFGKDIAEAEKEPHAIKYNKFTTINGIPFATNWTFHMWNDTDGYTDQIGEVILSNIQFLNTNDISFQKTTDSKLLEAPKNN